MNRNQALLKMVMPDRRRKGKPHGGVMQVWITRACDKSCFGCTQGSNLGGNPGFMTPDQFEEAVITLKNYFGTIGVFGGNPAISPHFEEICRRLQKHIPQEKCGLWCNNPLGKGKIMRETFNPSRSNLNVHLDKQAYLEFRKDWPESMPFGIKQDSRHSPVYVALKDVIPSEEARWELISNCDINKHWSAMVGVFRGQLRGWFCEIAGAQSMLHQHETDYPDTGVPIEPGWWKRGIHGFSSQVDYHCHRCGVPLRGRGELAQEDDSKGTEQVSLTHLGVYKPKRKTRAVQLVDRLDQTQPESLPSFTDYLGNSKR